MSLSLVCSTPITAKLYIVSSYVPTNPSSAPQAAASLWDTRVYGATTVNSGDSINVSYLQHNDLFAASTGWATNTQEWDLIPYAGIGHDTLTGGAGDTGNNFAYLIDTLSDLLNSLTVEFYVWDSLSGRAPATLTINDVYVDINVGGITNRYRPQTQTIIPPVVSAKATLTSDPPTAGRITMNTSGSFSPGFLVFSSFGPNTSPAVGYTNAAFSFTYSATGGTSPYTYAISGGSLPTGVSLNTSTGVISGTPTTAGAYSFTIQATDSLGATASCTCSITILIRGWLIINEPSIGLTDRSNYLYRGAGFSHNWTLAIRQRGQATVELFIAAGDTYSPTRATPIYLYDQTAADGYILVFAGLIQDLETRWIGTSGARRITITAVSLESVFDTVYVTTPKQYVNQTCGAIFTDLFNTFESGSPVTLGTISSGESLPLFNAGVGDKISDLFSQLADTSLFVWGVDPQTQEVFFQDPSTISAPFTLADLQVNAPGGDLSIGLKSNGADYRNRQGIKLSPNAFPHSMEFIVGAGQQTITLARPLSQVTNAYATLSTPNTATGSFSGQPTAGDTVTIGPASGSWQASHIYALGGPIIVAGYVFRVTVAGTSGGSQPNFAANTITGDTVIDNSVVWTCEGAAGLSTGVDTYTFVASIDNTQWGQVLIGATAAATAQNLVDCINANADVRGTTFSLPTWECGQCNAINLSGTSFTLQQKAAGTGWIASISTTSSAFSWSAAQTSGGTSPQGSLGPGEGATISLQVYEEGTSTAGPAVAYIKGANYINLASPLNVGSNLNVEYVRADAGLIEVENTADVSTIAGLTHGTGKYQQVADYSSQGVISTSAATGLLLAQQALAAYSQIPESFEFTTYQPGLFPGMTLASLLTKPADATASLNTNWVVEEISAEFLEVSTYFGNYGHYRYKVRMVNVSVAGSYLDFWKGLGGSASGGGAGVGALVPTSGGAQSTSGQASSLLTTKGDLLGFDTASNRIPVGADGTVLTADSTKSLGVDWKASPSISGIQQEAYTYAADTGSANAYAVTLSPAPSIVAGSEVVFKALHANTGASTLAVNGGSAIAITKNGTTALAGGEIAAGQIITVKYDGTQWQMIAAGSGGSGTVTSVALTVPSRQTVTGSPVTSSGTLAITDNTQSPNQVFAGPASGSAATPGFRALVSADLPLATTGAPGAVKPDGSTISISGGVISATAGGAGSGFAYGGDGSDGAVDFDGTNTYTAFTSTSGSAPNLVYTLTRDVFAATLTVESGKTLKTGNFRIFANASLTVNGTLHNNGTAGGLGGSGSGSSAGSAGSGGTHTSSSTTAGSLGVPFGSGSSSSLSAASGVAGKAGGTGAGTAGAAGTAGQTASNTSFGNTAGLAGAAGGAGGAVGGTSGGAAGAAGGASAATASNAPPRTATQAIALRDSASPATLTALSVYGVTPAPGTGGSGGAGAGDGTNAGGGSGGSGGNGGCGGHLVVASPSITVASTGVISSDGATGGNGGNGGSPSAGTAAGGGGGAGGSGGSGGSVILIYHTLTNNGAIHASGAAGGNGGTGGTGRSSNNGSNGSTGTTGRDGVVIQIAI